jgi:hypothetical protein
MLVYGLRWGVIRSEQCDAAYICEVSHKFFNAEFHAVHLREIEALERNSTLNAG